VWKKSTNNQQVNLCPRNKQEKKTPGNQPAKNKLTKFFKILWKQPFFLQKKKLNVNIVSKENSALIFQFCVNINETYAYFPYLLADLVQKI